MTISGNYVIGVSNADLEKNISWSNSDLH